MRSPLKPSGKPWSNTSWPKSWWERSQLTREAVKQHLTVKDEALAEQWDAFWEACEMQRYGASQGNLDALAQTLLTLGETTESRWS